jgi:hypothetical protein
LPPDLTDKLNGYFTDATNVLSSWLVVFFKYMIGVLGSFSSFMGNFGIAIILAFFLSMEIKDWKKIAHDKMPKTFKTAYAFLQGNVFKAIGSYLKAQLILIAITFVIVLVGLLILQHWKRNYSGPDLCGLRRSSATGSFDDPHSVDCLSVHCRQYVTCHWPDHSAGYCDYYTPAAGAQNHRQFDRRVLGLPDVILRNLIYVCIRHRRSDSVADPADPASRS